MEENKMELASNFIHDFIDEDLAAGVYMVRAESL